MEKIRSVKTRDDVVKLLGTALSHEWAVSFEYVIHAYSIPKGKYIYEDPVLKQRTDVRGQTIQIGIDEMYHALQLGIILTQMGVAPEFETDEVVRYPRIVDNLKRDKMTEEMVTDLYQSAELETGAHPKIENMIWNISYDEVRHIGQFKAMIDTLEASGSAEALCLKPSPERDSREDLRYLHDICRAENELMHRYLKYVMMFSEHQDLSQRLFKNAVNHMRHWDKTSGVLIKLGDVIAIENAERDARGAERSPRPMPTEYPGTDRRSALESLLPSEKDLVAKYERVVAVVPPGDVQDQLKLQLALTREHVFTQEKLLANALRIKGIL
ncbi:MAG: ferritin-like domain-containing protein [Candidatus Aminicenantales bacterium]|jgi:bacterioferritin (cytochrome b1)